MNEVAGPVAGRKSARARLLGFVKRDKVDHLAVSVVAYAGDTLIAASGDVEGGISKCSAVLLADASGERVDFSDGIRAVVLAQAGAPPPKAKKPKGPAKPQHPFVAESGICSMNLSADGKWIATTHLNQHVTAWDATTGEVRWSKRVGGSGLSFVHAAAFSPDSKLVASGASTLTVLDVATGEPQKGPAGHPKGELIQIVWTSDWLATVSRKHVKGADCSFALWSPSGELRQQWKWEIPDALTTIPGDAGAVVVCGYRKDRTTCEVCRVDTKTGSILASTALPARWLITGTGGVYAYDKEMHLLDPKTLEPLSTPSIGEDTLMAVAGSTLFTGKKLQISRRDAEGKAVATWKVPELEGAAAYLAALDAQMGRAPADTVRPYELEKIQAITVAGDRVFVATRIAMYVFDWDGKPVHLPSVAM